MRQNQKDDGEERRLLRAGITYMILKGQHWQSLWRLLGYTRVHFRCRAVFLSLLLHQKSRTDGNVCLFVGPFPPSSDDGRHRWQSLFVQRWRRCRSFSLLFRTTTASVSGVLWYVFPYAGNLLQKDGDQRTAKTFVVLRLVFQRSPTPVTILVPSWCRIYRAC